MSEFYEKEVETLNNVQLGTNETHRFGKNEEATCLLSESTKLVLVGTMIPDIPFFYTGRNNSFYKWVDDRKGTYLNFWKQQVNATTEPNKIAIDTIKKMCIKLGIAFLDIAKECYVKNNSSNDDDISCFVADYQSFDLLKKFLLKTNLKIITTSSNAQKALKHIFGIDSKVVNLTRRPKRSDWYPIIDEYL